jgi:cytochrome bd ubiquinol oxidase subunit I
MDVLALSRLQFALTIMFHYLFPPLTIGLGVIMVMIEAQFLRTKDPIYEVMARYWTRLFAVTFAMGVATGIVMEFEFGTNWATYSRYVGDIFGSALAAEGIFAFFLESGFLAIVVFGWGKVSRAMHFFATCMVCLGSIFSSVWIVVANSWQQTPAGYHIVGEGLHARAEITDFWQMVFNPSSVPRLLHVWMGSFILGAFFVMSISSYYLLRGRHTEVARRSLKIALLWGLLVSLLAPATGHIQGQIVGRLQPAKMAAFEGHFHTGNGPAPMYVIGLPDVVEQRVKYGLPIPGLLSFLVHDDFSKPVRGLDEFPKDEQPPIMIPFFSFHLMIGLGMGFLGLTALGALLLWRGKLYEARWLLRVYVVAVGGAFLANQAGWVAAEVGRQPWIVQGLLRTSDGLSRAVKAQQVLGSLIMFSVIYLLLFAVWVYVLHTKISHGPDDGSHDAHDEHADPGSGPPSLLEAASSLVDPSSEASLTESGGREVAR